MRKGSRRVRSPCSLLRGAENVPIRAAKRTGGPVLVWIHLQLVKGEAAGPNDDPARARRIYPFSLGSSTVKAVPSPSLLSAETAPPMLSTTLWTMARPRPELSPAVRLLSAR